MAARRFARRSHTFATSSFEIKPLFMAASNGTKSANGSLEGITASPVWIKANRLGKGAVPVDAARHVVSLSAVVLRIHSGRSVVTVEVHSAMGHLLGLAGRLGELGPYQVPVVGAEVAAGDHAICCALDGQTVLDRDGAALFWVISSPSAWQRLGNIKRARQCRLGATGLSEVGCELHDAIVSRFAKLVNSVTRIDVFRVLLWN